MRVEPNTIYVIPPGKNMVLGDGVLQLSPRTEVRGQHRPIDHFLRSLAEAHGYKAIAVILSGMGSDGSLGHGGDQRRRLHHVRAGQFRRASERKARA